MKIKQANAGVLTNFEVLDFLRSRGATSDPMGCFGAVAASECQVFDYLIQTAACNQTREVIAESMQRFEGTKLAKAEKLNIINLRPSTQPEIFPIIDTCSERFSDDEIQGLVDLVNEVFPPPPQKPEA